MELTVDSVGTTSVTYAWTVTSAGQVCVTGRHTAVHVDGDGRPAPMPRALRAVLEGR